MSSGGSNHFVTWRTLRLPVTYSLLLSCCRVVGMKSIARFSFAGVCVTQETKLLCGHYCTPTALSFAFTSDWRHSYVNVKTFNVESRAARACRVDRKGLHWEYAVSGSCEFEPLLEVFDDILFLFLLLLLKTWNTIWMEFFMIFASTRP